MSRIALGADHAGFALKEELKAWLAGEGHAVSDLGTDSAEAVDDPDVALAVADAVAAGGVDRGVLVCGTGIGMAMAANKVPGVRAAAGVVAETWLAADFQGGRHARRFAKLGRLDGRRREPCGVTTR